MGQSNEAPIPLVNIVTKTYPTTYSDKTATDYNAISTSEKIEPSTTYKIVIDATMPEGVSPAIAMGPGRTNDIVYFNAGLNGEQTITHTTPAGGTYTENRVYQRSAGQGSTPVTFTINSLAIYKM